ncbi:hypothetical protein JXK06_02000 [Patescibacteria group bacterium]|nr:hypothetical protein [Patescibacteria group bacterium]
MEKESRDFVIGVKKNFVLPGNPRYQPIQMKEIFGYDNLYQTFIEVELATLETLYEFGVIPQEDYDIMSPELKEALMQIPTTLVDELERSVTKHDIRALVQIMQQIVGPELGRWIHVPLTSYDVIDTGRSLQYVRAFENCLAPSITKLLSEFQKKIIETAITIQVGRTHGQHALPITVGFWLATVAERIFFNFREMSRFRDGLIGKISGAVGAYNAQVGLSLNVSKDGKIFEEEVLKKLGLKPAPISTQILPPESLAYFLFSASAMSASLGQFGRDGRNLMRSEIAEVAEKFSSSQVGSSTMAHKRNPINFENLEGMWLRTKNEFGKVLDTMISDHQRDLVGSSVARDLPIILINLQHQLNTLLRSDGHGGTFLSNIIIDKKKCEENFAVNEDLLMAEPIYIALQMAGYKDDAHHLVNHVLMGLAKKYSMSLFDALLFHAGQLENIELQLVLQKIPKEVQDLLAQPKKYIGLAARKALMIAEAINVWFEI